MSGQPLRRPTAGMRWIRAGTAAALIGLCATPGCRVAPLVQDAGSAGPLAPPERPGWEPASIVTADGITLRGTFFRAPDEKLIVLHLLPSGASARTGVPAGIGRIGLTPVAETLRGEGVSSLIIDYRGTGDSDGARDTARLLDDGRSMWREAVRRA